MLLQVGRFVTLAMATGRKPVLPYVPCDSTWIKKMGNTFQGLRDDEVVRQRSSIPLRHTMHNEKSLLHGIDTE